MPTLRSLRTHIPAALVGVALAFVACAPGVDAAPVDTDDDGLNAQEEKFWGTNRQDPDTDGDGLLDGAEVYDYFTDPTRTDSDDDGLDDATELALGTTAWDGDTDDDGVLDGAEVTAGTDPLDPRDPRPRGPR